MGKHIYIKEKLSLNFREKLIVEYFSKVQNTVILDSSLKSESLGCYTIIGFDPFIIFEAKGDSNFITGKTEKKQFKGNPLEFLRSLLEKYKTTWEDTKIPFICGCMGYFSYDLVAFIENIPQKNSDDINLKDIVLGFYNKTIVLDHIENELYCIGSSLGCEALEDYWQTARNNVDEVKTVVGNIINTFNDNNQNIQKVKACKPQAEINSNFNKTDYIKAVETVRQYIRNGDIYQVNLSQRFKADVESDPSDMYMKLRTISPAPFSAYLKFGQTAIISSSPERFLKITGKTIESRPIKGTRPRSKEKAADDALRAELIESEKDTAELTMIVDLVRNDLGRVCEIGSVKVDAHREIEAYANVFHTVSTVTGKLKEEKDIIDCLYAAFPGGSITGAPKIRAMEIIEELEPIKRNIYTGSIGFIDFNGNTDLNIAIRTIVFKSKKAYFSVGGGIVWDSEPEAEYDETMHKGKMMMKVLEEA